MHVRDDETRFAVAPEQRRECGGRSPAGVDGEQGAAVAPELSPVPAVPAVPAASAASAKERSSASVSPAS
ncbi:hypothetical protein ACN24M_03225 [Streptomyces microflavus]